MAKDGTMRGGARPGSGPKRKALTEAQKKAYILADNRFAQDAGWDEELLRIEIESLQGADFDVSLTGFVDEEIAALFAGDKDNNAQDDDFDLSAALEKTAFVQRGDIWTVGRHLPAWWSIWKAVVRPMCSMRKRRSLWKIVPRLMQMTVFIFFQLHSSSLNFVSVN